MIVTTAKIRSRLFLSLCLGALTLLGCQDGAGFGSSSERKKDSSSDDDEDERLDESVDVAGAFLTCAYLDEEVAAEDEAADADIGCKITNEKGDRHNRANHDFALAILKNDQRDDLASREPSDPLAWDVESTLPGSVRASSIAKIEMSVKRKADKTVVATEVISVSDIGEPIGADDLNDSGDGSADLPLRKFSSSTRWKAKTGNMSATDLASIFNGGLHGKDFCDENGPTLKFDTGSMISTTLSTIFFQQSVPPIEKFTESFDFGQKRCYRKFEVTGSKESSGRVHEMVFNDVTKCYIINVGDIVYTIDAEKTDAEGELSLESFEQFIETNNSCP